MTGYLNQPRNYFLKALNVLEMTKIFEKYVVFELSSVTELPGE
jgi:hypothetical protein